MNKHEVINTLLGVGISFEDAIALRRISMTLHRWHELECGTGDGHIERDETTGRPIYYNARARYVDPHDPRAYHGIPDREAGALKRLGCIMARYPTMQAYVQGDPRGAALFIGEGLTDSNYSNGVAVYK